MTNGINSIGGNPGGSNVFWSNNSANQNVDEKNSNEQQSANANQERKEVNPDDVMKFMAANTYFVPVKTEAKQADANTIDADTQKRVVESMKDFEELFSIVEQEFGADIAPSIFDAMMDKFLGIA